MFASLQKRYTATIILIATVFLGLLVIINYVLLRSHSISSAQQTSTMILSNADNQITNLFYSIESTVTALSMQKSIQDVDIEQMKDQFISHVIAKQEIVRAVYLGTADGQMYEWGVGPGFIENTPTFAPGYDPRERPWYKTAVETDSYTLTEPYLYASTDALGITAVKPVYKEGLFVGVLGLDIVLEGVKHLVDLIEVEKDGRLILLTQDNHVLANQFDEPESPSVSLSLFPYPELLEDASPSIHTVYGDTYMIQHTTNSTTGWVIMLCVPYQRIISFSLENMRIIIFYDILLMMLLGTVVTLLSRRLLTDPLNEIITVLDYHERGDIKARIREQKVPEFQIIATSFNNVVEMKIEQEKQMEMQVIKRTREVINLQKENIRLRIIEEKERIYSNLHDSLGARLTGINISNTVAKHAFDKEDFPTVRQMLDRIEYNTAKGISDLKEILLAKETDDIRIDEFIDFIRNRIRDRLALKHMTYESVIPSEAELESLDQDTLQNLVSIIEELVTNTLKYSEARSVQLAIEIREDRLVMTYADDGRGFDTKKAFKRGFGIPGILTRVERLGGHVKITTKIGKGARYSFTIPVKEDV
ncbi:MAG: cache domain-containing protein [Sphaerochaetaceae bacterium]